MITSKEIIEQFEIISHNIKFYRQNQNMSQEELAEKSDLYFLY